MTKKSDREFEIEWLDEHGPYEVCMMRYGLFRMLHPRADSALGRASSFTMLISSALQ